MGRKGPILAVIIEGKTFEKKKKKKKRSANLRERCREMVESSLICGKVEGEKKGSRTGAEYTDY